MKKTVSSSEFVQKLLFTAFIFTAAFFVVTLLGGAQAQAQTSVPESWTATADNYTNGADWNPAITGTPTNWPAEFNGIASADYRPDVTNGGTIYYVGPSVSDPYDPNWTNTVDQLYLGPSSGASSVSTGINTFIMEGGALTLGIEASGAPDGGAALAVGGFSVNSVSNNAVFTMTGGTLNDISDTAGALSDASLLVGTGSNALATVNLDGGTANFNNVYIAGRGIGIVNINGAGVNINSDGFGNSSSGGTPTYYVLIGFGSSGTLSANGKGAGTLNLISGELDVTNGTGIILGGRCNSATLNVSGGEIDTPAMQWGDNVSGKITNTFNLSGGLVNIGSSGLAHLGTQTNRLVISGGTFSTLFGESWSDDGSLAVTLSNTPGPGVANFAPAQGASITMSSVMKGPGSFNAAGPGQVILAGANAYTGSTMVSGGTLTLQNTIESKNIIVAGGATLDLTGLPGTLTLTFQVVSNSSSTAVLNGNVNTGTGTMSSTYNGSTPSFTITSGTATLSSGTTFNVNNTGSPLAIGTHTIVTAGSGGSVAVSDSLPAVIVTGGGVANGAAPSLSIDGGGNLDLVVSSINTTPTNIVFSAISNSLTLTWPMDHTGWQLQAQTNSVSVGINNNWANVSGSTITNQEVFPINPTNGCVFYRLIYPAQ
jgi:autotransporter-associated beta strand protein